ncbi:MAG: helix-turn-helix domain-containing protein [Paracoccaceae bacterium]
MTSSENHPSNWRDPCAPITAQMLATRWQKSIRTLQRWRAEGYGPAWIHIGGSIFFRMSDVLAFEERMRRGGGDST